MAVEYAVIAGGCFWCTEAIFNDLSGVVSVESGYTGGRRPHPSYEQVCSGATGHAEAIRIGFDPEIISYRQLLEIHFATHDPTQLNRQGNDIGTQYRSAIFPLTPAQHSEADAAITQAQSLYQAPIVTTIEPPSEWYPAEEYHQNYWQRSGQDSPFCMAVIPPKLQKLRKSFSQQVKS